MCMCVCVNCYKYIHITYRYRDTYLKKKRLYRANAQSILKTVNTRIPVIHAEVNAPPILP